MADEHFKSQFSSLSTLTDDDVAKLISESTIKPEDLAKVLQELKNATADNQAAPNNITNITNGVSALVGIAEKFI